MTTKSRILIVEDQFVEANHLRIMLNKAGYGYCPIARSVPEARQEIAQQRPDLVLLDIFLAGEETGIDLARELQKEDIGFIYLSANSNEEILQQAKATHPYGFLVKPFREKDLLVNLQIAAYHQEYGFRSIVRREKLFQQALGEHLAGCKNFQTGLTQLIHALQPVIPFDFAVIVLKNEQKSLDAVTGHLRIGFNEYQRIDLEAFQNVTRLKVHELQSYFESIVPESKIRHYAATEFETVSAKPGMKHLVRKHFGMNSNLVIPFTGIFTHPGILYFSLFSRQASGFSEETVYLCERLQQTMFDAIRQLSGAAATQAASIPPAPPAAIWPVQKDHQFYGIIGRSPALLQVFDQVAEVAPTETSVLLTGESGTGKESIADSLHLLSHRRKSPLVKVNCAALPANLIETELFGHEKGAFTGAIERRIGRFEQAHNGTLLLDEIGEMPLEMQSKLLRVLQQKEIERIGGKETIKINVRIIAATNRNLEKEVAEGRFRLDLYYRLNVFPIHLPPLRERKEDIGLLAQHFIDLHSRKNEKNITGLSHSALQSLLSYQWPGNIRELENLIERSIIVTKGSVIQNIPLPADTSGYLVHSPSPAQLKTIEENEREHILAVLAKCHGRIRGEGGAAEILGVPPTTLNSKIKRLGIKRVFTV